MCEEGLIKGLDTFLTVFNGFIKAFEKFIKYNSLMNFEGIKFILICK